MSAPSPFPRYIHHQGLRVETLLWEVCWAGPLPNLEGSGVKAVRALLLIHTRMGLDQDPFLAKFLKILRPIQGSIGRAPHFLSWKTVSLPLMSDVVGQGSSPRLVLADSV